MSDVGRSFRGREGGGSREFCGMEGYLGGVLGEGGGFQGMLLV